MFVSINEIWGLKMHSLKVLSSLSHLMLICSILVVAISVTLPGETLAATPPPPGVTDTTTGGASTAKLDDTEVKKATCEIFALLEGGLGSLLATVAGIGAIVAAAFGAYRLGTTFLVVAVGGFITRSLVSLWFEKVQTINCSGVAPPDDLFFRAATCNLYGFIEGPFGALLMTAAGVVAIIMVSVGGFRSAYSLFVVGAGAFVLRSLISLYYGDYACESIMAQEKSKIASFFSTPTTAAKKSGEARSTEVPAVLEDAVSDNAGWGNKASVLDDPFR